MSRLVPARPESRALAALAACMCAGVVVASRVSVPLSALLAMIAAGLALTAFGSWRRLGLVAVLGGVVALTGAGGIRGATAVPAHANASPVPTVLRGTVRDVPVPHRGETIVVVDIEELAPHAAGVTSAALAIPGRTDLLPGDRVEIQASALRRPGSRAGPLSAAVLDRGGVDVVAVSPRVTVLARGTPSMTRAIAAARAHITSTLQASIPEPQATLMGAVAFGIRGPLPAGLDNDLRDSGLLHLTATSGLKVAIVAGLVARLLGLVTLGPRIRFAITLAAVAAYVVLAGGGAAATRSALMAGVTFGLAGSGRRAEPLTLLTLIAAALLLADPHMAVDAGFQLTFLGTVGIIALAAPVAARVPGPRLIVEPFAVTVAAQAATVPVMAGTFGAVSLVGPFANALAVPLVPPLLALAYVGVATSGVTPWLGWPALEGAAGLAWLLAEIGHLAARVPGAAIHLAEWPLAWTIAEIILAAVLGLGSVTLRLRRHPGAVPCGAPHPLPVAGQPPRLLHRRLALCAMAVVAVPVAGVLGWSAVRPDGRLHVAVLASGSGPAVVVRTSAGGLSLIDSGSDPQQLLAALGAALPLFTRTLDQVILTGGERGAIGGLADLTSHFGVDHVVIPDADIGTAARNAVLSLREGGAQIDVVPSGSAWKWSGAAWRCVPAGPQEGGTTVQPVCALQVRDGAAGALVLGDLAPPAQEEVVAGAGDGLRSDLMVAPPTGLLAPALLAASAARYVAIPGNKPLGAGLTTAYPGVALRSAGTDGTLDYATGSSGTLEPV